MSSEVFQYGGREITLQSSNSTVLQQLRDLAVEGGLAALTKGLSAAVRVITVAVDVLVTGMYRIRVMTEHRQNEFEIARIIGAYELFQRARDYIDGAQWDEDLQVRAREDLDEALERLRRRRR